MNHQRTFHQQLLRSQRGSVLLLTLISGIVICIMFFSSIAYIESQATVLNKASTKTDRRVVLDGLYAYTVNAVKQSWCLSSNWAQDINCDLNHGRYTQRLLLSDETLLFIQNSKTPHPEPLANTRLKSFTGKVEFATLTNSHPIYSIITPVLEDYKYAEFTIERDSTAISAVRGREVPLKITIFLKHKTNTEFDQTLVSKNIVYPRELTYFALIVSNNLNLATSKTDPGTGNIRLENVGVANNGGLRFESPVFINGDLNLPPSSTNPAMNNVIFVDKVVLGGGTIKMDNNPYIVKTAGGDGYMFNYSMPNFAGMLGGFELDATRDTGLDYLFNIVKGTAESTFDVQKWCRVRLMASYDLSQTKESQLWVRRTVAETNTATVQFNLGNVDNFIEQGSVKGHEAITNVPGVATAAVTTAQGTPVMKATAYYYGLQGPTGARGIYTTEFYIHREGSVILYPSGMGGASIKIDSEPLEVNGRQQFNQVDLTFTFSGELNLTPYTTGPIVRTAPSVKFVFEAYDYGYLDGVNLRQDKTHEFYKKTNGLTFTKSGSAMILTGVNTDNSTSNTWSNYSGLGGDDQVNYPFRTDAEYRGLHIPPVAATDLATFDDRCFASPDPGDSGADYSAFPAAKWNTSFADQARHAWKFNPDYATYTDPGYNPGTRVFDGGEPLFKIDSLVNNCEIRENATLVAGFFVCEKLTITQRSKPLRIIGTIITNQIDIHQTAYTAGIRWSSIYHPQAVQEMINAKILGRDKSDEYIGCNSATLAPLWQSNIGVSDRYMHWICNPVSLRTSDPFKWTTVDPDCGIVEPRDSLVKCKKQTNRFLIKEVSRGKGL
ncbi:hypothetical protein [Bdellovibrio sp. HCB209]|uniref:hypothetical protein n=1 Tax=Bdellovibrio sp. HCB209 TaxID=3394354 RepID=UPI0039B4C98F